MSFEDKRIVFWREEMSGWVPTVTDLRGSLERALSDGFGISHLLLYILLSLPSLPFLLSPPLLPFAVLSAMTAGHYTRC